MIPKIIHYYWYGRGKLSSEIEMCIASWKKYYYILRPYEILSYE